MSAQHSVVKKGGRLMQRTKVETSIRPGALFISVALGLLCVVCVSALGAWAITDGFIPREHGRYLAAAALLAGVCVGSASAGRGEGGGVYRFVFAFGMLLCLLLLNLCCFGGSWSGVVPGAMLIFGTTAAWMLVPKRGRSSRKRRRKKKHQL